MKVFLTQELEELVKHKVKSGAYSTADEMVCEALWLLDARDRFREMQTEVLRKEIQKGLDSGPGIPGDLVFAEIREKIAKHRKKKE